MAKSEHLWAIGYHDMGRAEQVRDEIIRLGWDTHYLTLLDVAVVVRHPDGSFTCNREPFPAVANLLGCTAVGFLAGLVLLAPLTGAAIGALLGGAGTAAAVAAVGIGDAPGGNPEVILIASGSEVSLAVEAHEQLVAEGIRSRVVSMPSWDIFEQQTQEYRDSVLPPHVTARVAVEQASTFGWERYVGRPGCIIGMQTFGASALLKELQRKFGFEPDQVAAAAKAQLGRT